MHLFKNIHKTFDLFGGGGGYTKDFFKMIGYSIGI